MRRYLGLISFVAAAIWHLRWEAVRAWLFEQGFHLMNPYLFGITPNQALHWGPSLALVATGGWFFWKTRPTTAMDSVGVSTSRRDKFYRQTEEIRKRYVDVPPSAIEKDGLDFVVEGSQAQRDSTRILNLLGTEIRQLGKFAARQSWWLAITRDPAAQRRLYSRVAAYWNSHSEKLEEATVLFRNIFPVIIESQRRMIEDTAVLSKAEYFTLKEFATAVAGTHDAALGSVVHLEGLSGSALSLRGRTGELNAAANRISTAMSSLVQEIRKHAADCKAIETLALKKLELTTPESLL